MGGGSEIDECTSAARREGKSTYAGEKAPGEDEGAASCGGEGTSTKVTGSPKVQTGVGVEPCAVPGDVGIATAPRESREKRKE